MFNNKSILITVAQVRSGKNFTKLLLKNINPKKLLSFLEMK